MTLDFTNSKVSIEKIGEKLSVLDKVYDKYLKKIYEDYERFIKKDLLNLVECYYDNHIEIQKEPFISFVTKGSLFENIRTELLLNFFRENKLGEIKSFPNFKGIDENDVKYSLKTQFNITFNSNVTTHKLFDACIKENLTLEEFAKNIRGSYAVRIKAEIDRQRKENIMTEEIKTSLRSVIPTFEFDNPLIPYVMYRLIVNEFKRNNYFAEYSEEERLAKGLITIMSMYFDLEDISMITNIDITDIINITSDVSKTLIRD